MAVKKNDDPARVPFGRPSNTLRLGFVGLPNVGKSSTFNLMTRLNVAAENHPFCTIDPNEAEVKVPDVRFRSLVKYFKPASQVQAVLKLVDIAGLVPGAHEGAGLGNAFLSHISAVDGLCHIVRFFDDAEITHTEGDVDPRRDLKVILNELVQKDKEFVAKRLADVSRRYNQNKSQRELGLELEVLQKLETVLSEDKSVWHHPEWTNSDIITINTYNLLTAKPSLILCNMSKSGYLKKKGTYLKELKEWVDTNMPGSPMIPYSASFEQELVDAGIDAISLADNEEAVLAYEKSILEGTPESKPVTAVSADTPLEELASRSAVGKLIIQGYTHLNLIRFYTAGADEVRAWTLRKGKKAPEAAGVIHTIMETNFICSEIYNYEEFLTCGCTEAKVKAAGKLMQRGRTYEIIDGDICFFKFSPEKKK